MAGDMRVLMIAQSPIAGDSRILREATALADAGHTIHIIGRDVPEGFAIGSGITVESVSRSSGLRAGGGGLSVGHGRRGPKVLAKRFGRWLLLPEHRNRTEKQWRMDATAAVAASGPFDVVHAHDFNTLELAAEFAERWQAVLVYDSHELWFDRALPGRPTPLWRARGRRFEAELAAKARVVFTVSDGIAARLRDRGLADVRVIRNTFPRPDFIPTPLDHPEGLLYAGRVGAGRDLPTVVGAARQLAPFKTVLMGSVDPNYRLDLGTVEVVPERSIDEVDETLRSYGISLVTLTNTCENHRLALPNKLFHAVRAGVPVVAADLPELRSVVTAHDLGTLYQPGNPTSLANAVRALIDSYSTYTAGIRAAADELNWEHDAETLVTAYAELTNTRATA
ncbi:glycosyltransferase [Kribbella sandramycini]|uniref:Glycosyltransferase n=1 Tax=Kribbella sandramycini TaxID=60450 RepID=A0A7Y4P3E8_9ACTN|nr:glycosyltransferase involved in cell wall biosynthesis [Kribbella sandramycini]NOL44988.1 glycosyltransferase [Kribbella sandramycini]